MNSCGGWGKYMRWVSFLFISSISFPFPTFPFSPLAFPSLSFIPFPALPFSSVLPLFYCVLCFVLCVLLGCGVHCITEQIRRPITGWAGHAQSNIKEIIQRKLRLSRRFVMPVAQTVSAFTFQFHPYPLLFWHIHTFYALPHLLSFVPTRLFTGHYVKDLSLLNRDLSQTIIVDNSPMSYIFHPENAIDCGSFIDDLADIELWQVRRSCIDCVCHHLL